MTFHALPGGCHCGNIRLVLHTALDPEAFPLRACQCSFCVRHGARTTSEPDGLLQLTARDPAAVLRYRFGSGITDMVTCARCGVYVAATMELEARLLATVNVNVMDDATPFARAARPMRYDGETTDARIARRRASWMRARWESAL